MVEKLISHLQEQCVSKILSTDMSDVLEAEFYAVSLQIFSLQVLLLVEKASTYTSPLCYERKTFMLFSLLTKL